MLSKCNLLLLFEFVLLVKAKVLLEPLPFTFDELEPYISEQTLRVHYEGHLMGYINKVNKLIENSSVAHFSIEQLIETQQGDLFNQAAQVWNHNFYFSSMAPHEKYHMPKRVNSVIKESFGSYEKFKELFKSKAMAHFGSGWIWLVDAADKLMIIDTHDAMTPLRNEIGIPLLVCDIWEHAYYLDHKNLRGDYIDQWWNVINWKIVGKRLEKSRNSKYVTEEF